MSAEALPRSRPSRLAVMRATRSPSARRISAGPIVSSTSATAESGMAVVPAWATLRFRRSPALSRNSSWARRRMSMVRSSRVMSVTMSPRTLERTTEATCWTDRPRVASRSRLKRICSSGLPPSVEDLTSTSPGIRLQPLAPPRSASRSSRLQVVAPDLELDRGLEAEVRRAGRSGRRSSPPRSSSGRSAFMRASSRSREIGGATRRVTWERFSRSSPAIPPCWRVVPATA